MEFGISPGASKRMHSDNVRVMGIRDNRMVVLGRTRFQTGITLADTIANIVEQNGVQMPFDPQHTSQRTVTDARRRHEPTLWLIWPLTRICPHPCG